MTGESLPVLVDRLREAIERTINSASKWDTPVWRELGRAAQAHRKILDRHADDGFGDCSRCSGFASPCADVLDLASIYFPESETS